MLEMDRKLLAMDRDKMRNEFTGILFSSAQATIAGPAAAFSLLLLFSDGSRNVS